MEVLVRWSFEEKSSFLLRNHSALLPAICVALIKQTHNPQLSLPVEAGRTSTIAPFLFGGNRLSSRESGSCVTMMRSSFHAKLKTYG